MSIRFKIFLVVGVLFVVSFFGIHQILTRIVQQDFLVLEEREMMTNVQRVFGALDAQIDATTIKLADWAQWDDTYQFVQDGNEKFLQSNTNVESLTALHINFLGITDINGKIIFSKHVKDGQELPFPSAIQDHVLEDLAEGEISEHGSHREMLVLPEGPILFVAQSVTSSDGTAPPNGYIFFAEYLDQVVAKRIADTTLLSVELFTPDQIQTDSVIKNVRTTLSSERAIWPTVSSDERVMQGYGLVSNRFGETVAMFRVTTEREIFLKGDRSVDLFTRALLIMGIMFAVVLMVLIDMLVTRKLARLGKQVAALPKGSDRTEHLLVIGSDEFALLATRINEMLDALQQTELLHQESENRFKAIADSAPMLIWMTDAHYRYTYVNQAWLAFTGRKEAAELGDGWQQGIHVDDKEKFQKLSSAALAEKQPLAVELRLLRHDQTYGWFILRAAPHYTREGQFLGYVGSGIDITERWEAEQQQEQYVAEVEKMNKLMVERELRIVELKEQVRQLEHQSTASALSKDRKK